MSSDSKLVPTMAHYWYSVINYYYECIVQPDSSFLQVGYFWSNVLPQYFRRGMDCSVELEKRPLELASGGGADVDFGFYRVRQLLDLARGLISVRVAVLFAAASSMEWELAVTGLHKYLLQMRAENMKNTENRQGMTLFGAVSMGPWVRFYYLEPGEQELRDYVNNDRPLEIKDDKETIGKILTEWSAALK